jgi:hypothetical protein
MYTITEDGLVYSHIRKRWLKPQRNNCEYIHYHIKGFGWIFAHTLVAYKYLGPPPDPRMEINHIDGNRMNNHYLNLEWVTHSQNISKAYVSGRKAYWLGRHYPPHSLETRMKMANAKMKKVSYNGQIYDSIQEMADSTH